MHTLLFIDCNIDNIKDVFFNINKLSGSISTLIMSYLFKIVHLDES